MSIKPATDSSLLVEQPQSEINGIGTQNINSFLAWLAPPETTLPNSGTLTGESRLLTNTFSRLQLRGIAQTAITVPADKTIAVKLQAQDAENYDDPNDPDSWKDYMTLATVGAGDIKKGDTIFKFAMPIEPKYHRYRVVITTNFDGSAFGIYIPIEEFF